MLLSVIINLLAVLVSSMHKDWLNTWKAYKMTRLKTFYENEEDENWLFRYDNISEYYFRHGRNNPSLNNVPLPSRLIWNYNELPAHVNKTNRLTASIIRI